MSKRVAILVGGGDVPGLNNCLKGLVYRLIDEGFEPVGVRKGWEGLINYNAARSHDVWRQFHRADQSDGSIYRSYAWFVSPRLAHQFARGAGVDDSRPRQSNRSAETQDLSAHVIDVLRAIGVSCDGLPGRRRHAHLRGRLKQPGRSHRGHTKDHSQQYLGHRLYHRLQHRIGPRCFLHQ